MTTLHIQAELNATDIKSLTNLLFRIDPNATITQNSSHIDLQNAPSYKLDSKDEKRLKETLKLYQKGKLNFHSFDEAVAQSNEKLRSLGATI